MDIENGDIQSEHFRKIQKEIEIKYKFKVRLKRKNISRAREREREEENKSFFISRVQHLNSDLLS